MLSPSPRSSRSSLHSPVVKITSDAQVVGKSRARLLIVAAVALPFLASGLIFGYAALKPVLVQSGVYADECTPEAAPCTQQLLRLDLMFTIGAAATNAAALPIGATLDAIGPRYSIAGGGITVGLGCLMFAMSSPSFDLYLESFVLLALGGPCIFISLLSVSNLYTKSSGLIMSCSTGAFDASSFIFFVFAALYNHMGFSVEAMFYAYSTIGILATVVSCCLMPDAPFLPGAAETVDLASETQPLLQQESDVSESMPPYKTRSPLLSADFVLITAFMSFCMLRLNFYIATVESQALNVMPAAEAAAFSKFFSLCLPLGGVVGTLPVGWLLDSVGLVGSLWALIVMELVWGLLSMTPWVMTQYASIFIFALVRPFVYSFGSFYIGSTFGYGDFGKIYGTMVSITAIVNLLQYPIDQIVNYRLDGSFLGPNAVLTFLAVGMVYFPIALARKQAKKQMTKLDSQA